MRNKVGKGINLVLIILLMMSTAELFGESSANSGLVVDAYTQKAPYNGIGINQPSDPFSPNEKVIIYAKVTYNEAPCPSQLVTFIMFPPSSDLPFIRSNWTDEKGIAMCVFRVHLTYMGQWTVNVTTSIGQDIFSYDILTFNVTWIVNIEHVQILDKDFSPKDTFIRGETVNIGLELKNEAINPKNVTIEATFFDSAGTCIMNTKDTVEVFHGSNRVFITGGKIPSWAMPGNASLTINIYDRPPELDGQPYCPAVSETFRIVISPDIAITSISVDKTEVTIGENLTFYVSVLNNGSFTEDFSLYIRLNETNVISLFIEGLPPNEKRHLTITYNTSDMTEGRYIVKAYIPPLLGEENVQNNEYVDGTIILIRPSPPSVWNLFLILLVIMLLLLLLISLYTLRKRKKRKDKGKLVALVKISNGAAAGI